MNRDRPQDEFRRLVAQTPRNYHDLERDYRDCLLALGLACDVIYGCAEGTHNRRWAVPTWTPRIVAAVDLPLEEESHA